MSTTIYEVGPGDYVKEPGGTLLEIARIDAVPSKYPGRYKSWTVVTVSGLQLDMFQAARYFTRAEVEAHAFMSTWTVFDRPSDHPDGFIARRFFIARDIGIVATSETYTAATLDELHALLPPGLTCIARNPHDDAKIVETWL